MIRVWVDGVGLCGPGLEGWAASQAILKGTAPYEPRATRIPPTTLLPPNERRRAVQTVRLALAVGAEAFAESGRDRMTTPTIFASSGGDGDTIHEILQMTAAPNPELSPTRFHNSVHNTPAGYWGIATGSRASSTSICCYDDSFAAGLLEAAVMATSHSCAAAVIAYDVEYPEPLGAVRPIGAAFAAALLIAPQPSPTALASVEIALRPGSAQPTPAGADALENLRVGTPAARSLPLLEALAQEKPAEILLPYVSDMTLALTVRPTAAGAARLARAEATAGR